MFDFLFFDTTFEFKLQDGVVTSSFEKTSNLFSKKDFFYTNLDLQSNTSASFVNGKFGVEDSHNITISNFGSDVLPTTRNLTKQNDDQIFSIKESNNLDFSLENFSDAIITFHTFTVLSVSNFTQQLTIADEENIKSNINISSLNNQNKVDILFNSNLNITGMLTDEVGSSIEGVIFNQLQVNSNNFNLNFFDITNINGNGQGIINRNNNQSIFTDNLSIVDNLFSVNQVDFNKSEITNIGLQYGSNSVIETPFKSDIIPDNINKTFLPNNDSYRVERLH